ncbi:MAG TPA: hypothetical protein VK604_09940 [Bryobacteraceae bacterium]|nr:hypothetical protein [Bryobacteraceae bacterium]
MSGHNESPKYSEPVLGHHGTNFENVDAKASMVLWSLAAIGLTLVIVFAFTVFLQRTLQKEHPLGELPSPLSPARVLAPAPQLQVNPWEELPDMRAHEDEVLNSSGKDKDGHVHVPISQAMDTVVSSFKIAPGATRGITTPGGEGRTFAGSLNDMPAAYRPSIQGEIQKNVR